MRSYEECKQIANQLRNKEIEDYPIEVLERDGDTETIVFLTFGLDGDMGFWKVDRLRDTYHLTRDKAIDLISQHEQPKIYALRKEETNDDYFCVGCGKPATDREYCPTCGDCECLCQCDDN
jgi:hypothetical protein